MIAVKRQPSILKAVYQMICCQKCSKYIEHPIYANNNHQIKLCSCSSKKEVQDSMHVTFYMHNVPTVNGYPEREDDCIACKLLCKPTSTYGELHMCER